VRWLGGEFLASASSGRRITSLTEKPFSDVEDRRGEEIAHRERAERSRIPVPAGGDDAGTVTVWMPANGSP
jgi:hypothetical protein